MVIKNQSEDDCKIVKNKHTLVYVSHGNIGFIGGQLVDDGFRSIASGHFVDNRGYVGFL